MPVLDGRCTLPVLLAGLLLALLGAACGGAPGKLTPATSPPAATAVAATSNALVEAWAVATGTALRLTSSARLTPAAPSFTPGLGLPLATATLAICNYQATDCGPGVPTPSQPPATATPVPPTHTRPRPTSKPPVTPAPASATPSPSAMDCYAKTCQRLLLAPDGQRTWPETCTYLGMDMDCYVTFPNSQQTAHYRWSVIWSADGQFLAVPEGGSHDTPPAGYEIWNMAEGVKTSRIAYNGILQRWSPTGHTVAYVKRLTSGDQEFWLMDAATGAGQPTRQCPSWATDPLKISDYFDWRQVCDIWVPPAGQPVILSFTVAPSEASPGDNVTVTWASANATSARLRTYASNSTDAPEMAVPPSGSLVVTISKDDRFAYMFYLTVTDDAGQADQRLRSVSLLCPAAFFFTTSTRPITGGCPYKPPAFVAAAQQTFEHGQMLWLAPLPPASTATGYGPGATVYILYNAGVMEAWATWQTYDDVWTPALPESDPALEPPAGLYQPLRGFGKIWRETPGLRDKLGWATALEQGFNGAYQVQWRLGQLPGDVYLRAAGGSILYLQSDGNWWYRM